MSDRRFVVELREPVPAERVTDVAATIAGRFGMDPTRVHKLLSGRIGPVTKPVLEDKADLIARAFVDAGVAVAVFPADAVEAVPTDDVEDTPGTAPEPLPLFDNHDREPTPSTMFLSSTRWVPSPHEAADPADLGWDEPVQADEGQHTWATPPQVIAAVERAAPLRPPRSGTSLRTYLLVGFAASLALLLVLQAANGITAGRSQRAASVEAGMKAYGDGDFASARRLWMPLAHAGDPRAQYMLGYMAEHGQGRPWSNHDAASWYRLAANQGYPQAQVGLGQLYQRGMGVPRDPALGAQLFEQAAREGYGPAQFQYAMALFHGAGVAQDFQKALSWFRAAADSGVVEAQPYVAFAGSAAAGRSGAAPPAGTP